MVANIFLQRVTGISSSAISEIIVLNNPRLSLLELTLLRTADNVSVAQTPGLDFERSLPQLHRIECLKVRGSDAEVLHLPVEFVGEMDFYDNPRLRRIHLPHLQNSGRRAGTPTSRPSSPPPATSP